MRSTKPQQTLGPIHQLMTRVLADVFKGDSWRTWRVLLRAAFEGLEPLTEEERALVTQITARSALPSKLAELWIVAAGVPESRSSRR